MIFLLFLMSCTLTHFLIAESAAWLQLLLFPARFPWHERHLQKDWPSGLCPSGLSCIVCHATSGPTVCIFPVLSERSCFFKHTHHLWLSQDLPPLQHGSPSLERKGIIKSSHSGLNTPKSLTSQAVVVHTFSSSTGEAEAGEFLSLRPAWSTEIVPG